jgi:hypothetical protein
MTSQQKRNKRKQSQSDTRRVVIRGIRHDPPDLHKLAKVIVSLAETPDNENFERGSSVPQKLTQSTVKKLSATRPEAA